MLARQQPRKPLQSCWIPRQSRLQCYEGLTANEALYDWNYQRQLLSIRLAEARRQGYLQTYRKRICTPGVSGGPAHPAVPCGTLVISAAHR